MPKVSVVISVYNAAPFIGEAIKSMLDQSFTDIELIIINDGSEDNSSEVISSFNDSRIIFLDEKENRGAPSRFNQGIEMASGEYIAHLGADDISLPERLKLQLELMESNKDIGVCGTDIMTFNSKKKLGKWFYPEHHDEILVRQFFSVGFAHPAVTIRRKVLTDNNLKYTHSFFPAEDYDMWYRLLKVTKGYNIRKPLVKYRISETQATATKKELVENYTNQVRKRYLNELGIVDEDKLNYHCLLLGKSWEPDKKFVQYALSWFEYLVELNEKNHVFKQDIFIENLSKRALTKSLDTANKEFNSIELYKKSLFSKYCSPDLIQNFKLFLRTSFQILF